MRKEGRKREYQEARRHLIGKETLATFNNKPCLVLATKKVDEPAASKMLLRLVAVFEDILVVATRFLECVAQDRQAVEGPVLVDRLGHLDDGAVVPRQA